jgi:multidrug transporter EmrE-like cation transporter
MVVTGRIGLVLLILVSVSLNAGAQILLRWGAKSGFQAGLGKPVQLAVELLSRPGIVGGFFCYALSIVVWIYVLSRIDVSYAYPFLGLGFVFVAVASYVLLGEPLSLQRLAGTALVAIGVVVIARG